MPKRKSKIFVDRPGEDQMVEADLVAHVAIILAQPQRDVGMVEHALEHRGVAVGGHRLERVGEIAVVVLVRVGTRAVTDLSSSDGSMPHCLRV